MVGRLIAIALTVVITGAPLVTAACEAVCAARVSQDAAAGEHHSCHHESSKPPGTTMTSGAHMCGHSDEGPSAVGQSLWLCASPAIIVDTFAFAPPSHDAPSSRGASEHGPPLVSPRSTHLRI